MTVPPSPEEIARASEAEIEAGRLPLQAQWRIAEYRAAAERGKPTFTSALTVDEFAVLRSVGFEPVSQVMGSAVYNMGWLTSGCGAFGFQGGMFGGGVGFGGGFAGGTFRPYVQAPVVDVPERRQLLDQARHRAMGRMSQECAGLGADGVVGVRLTVGSFYGNGLEFVAVGTAVRAVARRDAQPRQPFTSDLSGQDFATLLRAGWLPVALVQGVGCVRRHDDWSLYAQGASWYNQEVSGTTALVQTVRTAARDALTTDARRVGGHTVVLRDMSLRTFETPCGASSQREAHDHVADAFLWGTAIVPLRAEARGTAAGAPPLQMLRLDDRRRDSR